MIWTFLTRKGHYSLRSYSLPRQIESKSKQQEIELEREKEATETKNLLIKNIGAAATSGLPTLFKLILMLSGKGGNLAGPAAAEAGDGLINLIDNLLEEA